MSNDASIRLVLIKHCHRTKLLIFTSPATQLCTPNFVYLGEVHFCSDLSDITIIETLSALTPQFLHEQLWPQEQEPGPPQLQVDPQSQAMMTDVKL